MVKGEYITALSAILLSLNSNKLGVKISDTFGRSIILNY